MSSQGWRVVRCVLYGLAALTSGLSLLVQFEFDKTMLAVLFLLMICSEVKDYYVEKFVALQDLRAEVAEWRCVAEGLQCEVDGLKQELEWVGR